MFRFSEPAVATAPPPASSHKQFWKRGLALVAGFSLLWLAIYIMPEQTSTPRTYSDEAGTVATANHATPGDTLNTWRSGGQLLAGLLLVGLVGFALYRNKRTAANRRTERTIQPIGRLQLGPQQHVHLIECGDEAYLVGATSTQITLLHRIPTNNLRLPEAPVNLNRTILVPNFSTPDSTLARPDDFASLLNRYAADAKTA